MTDMQTVKYSNLVGDAADIRSERFKWSKVLADMQTVKYFNLVGDEEDIGNERFKWSHT